MGVTENKGPSVADGAGRLRKGVPGLQWCCGQVRGEERGRAETLCSEGGAEGEELLLL